jgi:hypothetical protein
VGHGVAAAEIGDLPRIARGGVLVAAPFRADVQYQNPASEGVDNRSGF